MAATAAAPNPPAAAATPLAAEPAPAASFRGTLSAASSASAFTPKEFAFTWTLDKLSTASFTSAAPQDEWWSDEFRACGVRWKLSVQPGVRCGPKTIVDVFVNLVEPGCSIELHTLSVKRLAGAPCGHSWRGAVFSNRAGDLQPVVWDNHGTTCMTHEELLKCPDLLMPGGRLTITVTMRARSFAEVPLLAPPTRSMSAELGALLASGEGADVTFHAGDERFAAHSAILVARSAALKPHLAGPLASAAPFVFTVPEQIVAPIFRRVLQFIYTDELSIGSPEEAQHLLHAASFYGLPRLQGMCESQLHKELSPANVVSTLELAHLNGACALRDAALRFVAAHADAVTASEAWAELKAAHPELADAAVHTLVHGEPPKRIGSSARRTQATLAVAPAVPAGGEAVASPRGIKRRAPE